MAADQSGYEQYRKPTRRDEFLATMEAIVPWAALCAVIEPHYPKAGNVPSAHRTVSSKPSMPASEQRFHDNALIGA